LALIVSSEMYKANFLSFTCTIVFINYRVLML
jgi:hypothetical protein